MNKILIAMLLLTSPVFAATPNPKASPSAQPSPAKHEPKIDLSKAIKIQDLDKWVDGTQNLGEFFLISDSKTGHVFVIRRVK